MCTVSFHVQQDIELDMWNQYLYYSRLHSPGCFNDLDLQYPECPLNTTPLPQTCVSFYLLVKLKTFNSQLLTAYFFHILQFYFKHTYSTDSINQNIIVLKQTTLLHKKT